MRVNNEPLKSKPAAPILAWVFASVITLLVVGAVIFYLLWSQAENERIADYKQGWTYDGASEILKMEPNEPRAHSAMASVWMKQKQYGKAVVEYRKTVTLEPRNPYNHLDLGNALLQLGHRASARKEWQKAVALDIATGQAKMQAAHQLGINK